MNVVVKHVSDYSASREKNDLGFLTFDLEADLTPLFNWNVKQLFLYLSAEYETPRNAVNQVRKRFAKGSYVRLSMFMCLFSGSTKVAYF